MALDKEMQAQKLMLLGAITQLSDEDQIAIKSLTETLLLTLREANPDIASTALALVGLKFFDNE